MASEINPSLTPTKSLSNFRFWCQKVLPLVYDDSLSYYEVLGKMVVQLNDVIDNVNADTENVLTLKDAFLELQTYVNEFFEDIDQLASYAERAETAQTAANQSAINASESAANASASSLTAMNARDAANSARQAAETSANTASTAADNANTKANEAAQSAITAQTAQASASQSATLAATDRSAAQTAASTATTKASEASTSASNAATSAENAEQSKTDAEELVESVQESLDNIQQNTDNISELKESLIAPYSITSLYKTYSFKKTYTSGGQYISLLHNLIIIEKNTADGTNWHDIHFMLPIEHPVLHTESPTIVQDNINNFQPRLFDKIRVACVTDKSDLYVTAVVIYTIQNNEIITRVVNNDFSNGQEIITPLNADELASDKILVSLRIRSNSSSPTANAKIVIDFINSYWPSENLNKTQIAPTLNSMITNTALSINDFRIVGDTLYKVTAPIASGGTLTVGTNVVAITITDVLKTLLNQ